MGINIAQTLQGTVTQGSADAFVQAAIVTALTGQLKQAYRILGLTVEMPRVNAVAAGNVEVCFTRRTKAAMPNISDVDVIRKFKVSGELATQGGHIFESVMNWIPQGDVLIVEDPIYVQLDSNATTLTQSAHWKLEYEVVTISEVDRLNLLARSLT